MYYKCVNQLHNFCDTLYSIISTCIFDAFKAMMSAPSFCDVRTCHWFIQKSRGLEVRNLWILEAQSIMFSSPKRPLPIILRRGVIFPKKRLLKSSMFCFYRSRSAMFYLTQI